ncbi:S66 peptidase family protein [Christiangramia sabulilitoris]|uniref:LD-carboxypeptidase n=1 Tax=Christiangramia sabulilitoris TaxID=2583991 RepID=A0A550I3S1_9FLAO|nr:LD-carboxypeptidase [Christiangramia sabulilitoris]TRO65616.1 LD-carboxypeptidase [Christiangramia sabulilitoris]
MKRRKFIRNIGIGGLLIPLDPLSISAEEKISFFTDNIIPEALKQGDTIGIVSPAGAVFESEPYEIAKESFEAMGLQVKFGKYTRNRYGHLAGTDEERAEELNFMFRDKEIKAIIALRGGSGAARILELLDYEAIRKNPKIFVGYSDITALHLAIYEQTRLVTFHGPVAISTWNSFSTDYFKRLLFQKEAITYENPVHKGDELAQTTNRIKVIQNGTTTGELLGGNLSVLTGIMGSDFFPSDWKGKILYLEEIGEKIYAVDRMMSQLKLGGVLEQISGFVFGKCTDCDPGGSGYGSLTMDEVIDHYIKPLNIPAFSGAMIGHISDNVTIPNGIKAEMDAGKGTIKLLSPAVK